MGELERAEARSNDNRTRRRVRRVRNDFCAEKSHFSEHKLEGVVVAGELAPPPQACQKDFLVKLTPLI